MPDELPYTPRRSILYTPGTRPDRIEKALAMDDGPDAVVADLEDAVGPDDKAAARKQVAEVVARVTDAQADRCIRVNAQGTPWHAEDLEAAVRARPDAIVVPKVDSIRELSELELDIEPLEEELGIEIGTIPLLVQIETAKGVARAIELAETIVDPVAPLTRVEGMMFGALDYARDIGARNTPSNHEVLYARQRVVLAAALAEVQPIDLLFDDYTDPEGLAREAREGRDMGYAGKQIIHPDQIGPVHEAFTPNQDEIDEARELLDAVDAAGIEEGGVIGFKGRMIDRPAVEQAKRTVALAEALGL